MTNNETKRAYVRLVTRLDYIVSELERLGENDMGIVQEHIAGQFHSATDSLRGLTRDLKQCAYWPHERV